MTIPRLVSFLRQSFPREEAVLGLLAFTLCGVLVVARQNVEDVQIAQAPSGLPVPRDFMPMPSAPAPTGTALISGVVVSADGSRPVRRATVRLASTTPSPPRTATADDQGRFRFENVAAGRFTLTASKPGYLDSVYGQRRPGSGRPGTPLPVSDGQRLERLSLAIARGGVLAGTVVDEGGEPAFATDVRALRYVWQGGERVLRLVDSVKADDRGGYRIGALPPGDYVVMATPAGEADLGDTFGMMPIVGGAARGVAFSPAFAIRRPDANLQVDSGPTSGYTPVYYPSTTSSRNAATIRLDVSEEHAGLDLQLSLLPMGRITGTVAGDGTRPIGGTELRLINVEDALPGMGVRSTVTAPDGQFSFENVAPGRYRVQAHSGPRQTIVVDQSGGQSRVTMQFRSAAPDPRAGAPFAGRGGPGFDPQNQQQLWAAADVTVVGRNTETVSLSMQRGLTVSGKIAFDGTGQPPTDLASIRIVLNTSNQSEGGMQSAMGQVSPEGTFAIADVVPGTYRVAVVSASNWRPKSFDVTGRDALDFLLEVTPDRSIADAVLTLTTRAATLSGTLQEASGQPTAAYTIVLFAEDPTYWTPQSRRIHATRPATDGRFSLGNLPAGSYRLVAVEDLEDGQWFDPALLRQIAGAAIPIVLGDAESKTQDIRVNR